MLAEMLDTPIAKLAVSNEVNVIDDLLDSRPLLFLDTVLEDVLYNQAAGFSKGNLMPHAAKSLVDFQHDLRGLAAPTKLEQLLPDMTSIAMDDSVGNASKKLSDHVSLVALWNGVKSLLDDVAAESVHTEGYDVAMYGFCDSDDLVRCAVLEATLNEEVAEAVDHQRVCLVDDGLNNLKLLLSCAHLELLLQEDGRLLIIVAHNLVNNILPVAGDGLVKETAIVHRLKRCDIGLTIASGWEGPLCSLCLKGVHGEIRRQGRGLHTESTLELILGWHTKRAEWR